MARLALLWAAMMSPMHSVLGSPLTLGATVGVAIKFESVFADFRKVVDGSDT